MKTFIIKLLYGIISFLDKKNRSYKKLIKTFNITGVHIFTPEGWSNMDYIHLTRPFERYIIKTKSMFIECADDHIMYSNGQNRYAREFEIGDIIDTINGPEIVESIQIDYNRVSMCDITVNNNSHTYYTNNILSHNTTTTSIFALHYMLFNIDKNTLVLANSRKTSLEIILKMKQIFMALPYFMKPGVYKWNEAEIQFDNGCNIKGTATTPTVMLGMSISLLIWDEAAFVSPNIIDKFYNNMFPVLAATQGRLAISSTQNGYNLFYRLWTAAVNGENDFKPFLISWDRIPEWNPEKKCWEKRDDAWRQRQIANYGSEEAFNAQFGTSFDISASTLISQKILTKKSQNLVQFINKDIPGVPLSEYFFWHPDYEPSEQLKKDSIIITCDIAEGIGKDYTVFMINRLINPGTNDSECIGMFRCNSRDRNECASTLQYLCIYHLNPDRFLLSLEYNTYGELFLQCMYNNMEKVQEIMNRFDPSCFVKYYNESGTRYINGIKLTAGNKTSHCLLFKEGYERGSVINDSAQFMTELNKFCDDGTNHYKASFGHDDMVMAQIQLEFVKKTLQYKMMRDEYDVGVLPTNDLIYNPFEDSTLTNMSVMSDYYNRLNN